MRRVSTWPSPDRTYPERIAGERESLDAWVDLHRATLLMKCAGLELEALYGGFDGEPLTDGSREYVFVARG